MDQDLPHPTYDTLFKMMLQDPIRAKAFIRAATPPKLAKLINSAPRPVDVRNYTRGGVRKECDALFKVLLDDGRDILVLFEHKSSADPNTLEQVNGYLTAIRFGGLADEDGSLSDLLVAPIVYYHGKDDWNVPKSTAEGHKELPEMGIPYSVTYRFVKPGDLETSELEKCPDVHTAVAIQGLMHLTDAEISDSQLEQLAMQFALTGFGKYLCQCAMQFLNVDHKRLAAVIERAIPKEENAMPTVAKQIKDEGRVEGRVEGPCGGPCGCLA